MKKRNRSDRLLWHMQNLADAKPGIDRERKMSVIERNVGHWIVKVPAREARNFVYCIGEGMRLLTSSCAGQDEAILTRLLTLQAVVTSAAIEIQERSCSKCGKRIRTYHEVDQEDLGYPLKVCGRCKSTFLRKGYIIVSSGIHR